MRDAGGTAGRALARALTPTERLMVGVVVGAALHALLLLFLEFAVRIPWPQPRTYLGSVTVELDVPAPEPLPTVEPQVRAAPAEPTASVAAQPAQVQPRARPQEAPRVPARSAEPVESIAPEHVAVEPPKAVVTPPAEPASPGPEAYRSVSPPVREPSAPEPAEVGGRQDAVPAGGADREPVAVAQAPVGSQASREVTPPAEVAAPFDPFRRTTETPAAAPTPTPEPVIPLAQSRGGAQGSTVGPSSAPRGTAGSLMDQLDRLNPATPGSVPGSSSGTTARATGGALPLVDPGGSYQIRNPELEKAGRGLLAYVPPDLSGVEPAASAITVEVKILVASSGEVMDPRVVRHAPNPVVDARILQAVRRWQFTPAPSDTPMVEATVTFTVIPRT